MINLINWSKKINATLYIKLHLFLQLTLKFYIFLFFFHGKDPVFHYNLDLQTTAFCGESVLAAVVMPQCSASCLKSGAS